MIRNEKAKRDPLFHISKRETLPFWKSAGIRAIAIVAALLLSGILSAIFIGVDPFTFIGKLFEGVFGTERRIWTTLRNLSVLLLIALALAPAFKMKFWNIGAEGQVLIGGLACAVCMYFLGGKAPDAVVYLCMAVSGILAAALWAVVPAIFKAFWGTNETLFTLMMNYVAMQAVSFFTSRIVKDGSGTMKNATHLHGVQFPQIGNAYLLTILVAVVLTVGMWIYLRYSKHGYELSVVGESENTARYIGINVKKVIIRTMALSGAICGVAGVLLVGAINGTVTTSTAGGQGFTAIIVAWLGKFNPVFMILTSFLLVFLDKGTSQLNLTNNAFASMITGIVFFFIIGCEFFVVYRLKFRRHVKKESASDASGDGNAETPHLTETERETPTDEKSDTAP
ncbi:MAG: ABC transporter permease, partial [Candidatus Gallimonas sp.]